MRSYLLSWCRKFNPPSLPSSLPFLLLTPCLPPSSTTNRALFTSIKGLSYGQILGFMVHLQQLSSLDFSTSLMTSTSPRPIIFPVKISTLSCFKLGFLLNFLFSTRDTIEKMSPPPFFSSLNVIYFWVILNSLVMTSIIFKISQTFGM